MAGTRRVTLRGASEELGVSVEAVRKRVKRGSLRSDKDPDGRVYVYLDAGGDASRPQAEAEGSELVEELRRQNEYLRGQLDIRTEELREHRRLLAGLIERVPELEAPRDQGGATERPESPETVEEGPESTEPRPAAGGTQEVPQEPQARPWWRRMFGR
jgi:hypothetical protein